MAGNSTHCQTIFDIEGGIKRGCDEGPHTIHLGGSGTTHLGLKHGCATLIIPHIIDQYVWNNIVHQARVGPKGIEIGKLTTSDLEPKILALLNDASYKRKTEGLARQMRGEDYREKIYLVIMEGQNPDDGL